MYLIKKGYLYMKISKRISQQFLGLYRLFVQPDFHLKVHEFSFSCYCCFKGIDLMHIDYENGFYIFGGRGVWRDSLSCARLGSLCFDISGGKTRLLLLRTFLSYGGILTIN